MKKELKKMFKRFITFFSMIMIFTLFAFSWHDNTHKLLSKFSVLNSKLGNSPLLQYLYLPKGLYNQILEYNGESKSILEWINWGSIREDEKLNILNALDRRFDNHFHNPRWSWENAGLNDNFDLFNIHIYGMSSLWWAQNGYWQEQFPEGDQSWKRLKSLYLDCLLSDSKTTRDNNSVLFFKCLGHQIHLIQDPAVPGHSRNDSHMPENHQNNSVNFENWVEHYISLFGENGFIGNCASHPLKPIINLNVNYVNDLHLEPIALLTDANVYNDTNPSGSMSQGIAEYSNSNFFSPNTIFTEGLNTDNLHYFPFPNKASTNLFSINMPETICYDDNKEFKILYVKKITNGDPLNHLVAIGYLTKYIGNLNTGEIEHFRENTFSKTFLIDEYCLKDYASMIIPRAVGYSSTLIDYLFRGELEISFPEEDGIYSLAAYEEDGFFDRKFSVTVKNNTPNENMENGDLYLVIRYRENNDSNEFSSEVPPTPNIESEIFKVVKYTDENGGKVSMMNGEQKKFEFDLKSQPIPINATDLNITIVFKGKLGYEEEGIAFGFKDISEPTVIEIYNNTDKVCFNGSIVDYSDSSLFQYADKDQDGKITGSIDIDIIPRVIKFWYLSFNGLPAGPENNVFDYQNPENEVIEIQPGESRKIYILTDENRSPEFNLNMRYKRPDNCLVPYIPSWAIPYYHLQYFWEMIDITTPAPPKFFTVSPRINKLEYNSSTNSYEHKYPNSENHKWNAKDKYFFNLIYLSQPNHPKNCNCEGCNSYYPPEGLEWKANYFANNVLFFW